MSQNHDLSCEDRIRRFLGNGVHPAGDAQVMDHQVGHQIAQVAEESRALCEAAWAAVRTETVTGRFV